MAFIGSVQSSNISSSIGPIGLSGSVIISSKSASLFPTISNPAVKLFVDEAALFNSSIVSSGSFAVKKANGSDAFSVNTSGDVSIAGQTTFSGMLNANGGLSVDSSAFTVADSSGDVATAGTLQVAQSITGSSSLTISGPASFSSGVTVGQGLAASYADIGGGYGTSGVSISAAGNIQANGDLTVDGAASLGSLGVSGNGQVSGNLVVSGDLTVNGTTTSISTTNLEVKDSLIGLGYASGSSEQADGDRGLVMALAGNNVAAFWDNSASEFAFASTTSGPGDSTISVASYSNLQAAQVQGTVVKASLGLSGSLTKLTDGSSFLVAGAGVSIVSASNGAITIAAGAGGIGGSNTQIQFNDGGSFGGDAGLTYNKTTDALTGVTGSFYQLAASNALSSAGTLSVSGLSTFTGQSTHNGGISTTTLAASSNATILGALGVTGNITGQSVGNQLNALAITGSAGLSVTSAASVGSTLTVTGQASLNGGLSMDSGLFTVADGSGNVATAGTLSVLGASTFTGNISAAGTSNQVNALAVTGSLGASITSGLSVGGVAALNGDVDLGNAITDSITFTGRIDSDVLPIADALYNMGSPSLRWANMYTGDLHLRNERGDYTLIEEPDFLSIRFNKTGKRYKFLLEAVPELDEELGNFSKGPQPG